MPRFTVLLLGLVLATMFLLEPAGSIQAAVTHPPGQDGDKSLPAAPLLDHQCNYFGNFFDGRYQANVNNTGARARIGYVGNVLVPICNPVAGGNPVSTSTSCPRLCKLAARSFTRNASGQKY